MRLNTSDLILTIATTHSQPLATSVLGRGIFIALLWTIPIFAAPYGATPPLWIGLLQLLILLIGVAWTLDGVKSGGWFVAEHKLLLPIVALLLYAVFQIVPLGAMQAAGVESYPRYISAMPYETKWFAWRLLALILFAAMLMRYVETERHLQTLTYVVIGTGIASGLFGLVRQTTDAPTFLFDNPELARGTFAQFVNRNHFAYLAEMVFGVCLGLLIGDRRKERSLIYLALLLPCWLSLVSSRSRGGLLGMFAAIIIVLLLVLVLPPKIVESRHRRRRSRSSSEQSSLINRLTAIKLPATTKKILGAFGITILFGAILIGVVWIGGDPLATRVERARDEFGAIENNLTTDGASRAEIWQATRKLIAAHPIAGSGFGAFDVALTRHHVGSGMMYVQQAHNDYLELLAGGGIIAALLFVWFVVWTVRAAIRKLRVAVNFDYGATVGALGGIAAIAVHNLVEFGLHTPINALVFMSLLVLATRRVAGKKAIGETRSGASNLNARRHETSTRGSRGLRKDLTATVL